MQWQVIGADRATGQDRTIAVDARDAREAEAVAARQGLLVCSVQPAPPAESPGAAQPPPTASAPSAAPDAARSAVLAYHGPSMRPASAESPLIGQPIPAYLGLQVASMVLMALAVAAYAIGGILLVFGLGTMSRRMSYMGVPGIISVLSPLLLAGGPLVAGALCHALSAACMALRDMARNSFVQVLVTQLPASGSAPPTDSSADQPADVA